MKKLSIIIPAYNEERSISQILGKIHQTRLIGETENVRSPQRVIPPEA